MNKYMPWLIGCGALTAVTLVILSVIIGMGISARNQEVRLRNAITAKQTDNSSEFDNMWKKISQVAQVTDAQKNSLKEIFVEHAQARTGTGGGGSIAKWVQESVPNVDVKVYNQLINVITASRDSFTMRQKELLDLNREHDNIVDTFPSGFLIGLFGGDRSKIKVQIVTSGRTDEAFRTGKDDDVSVFPTKTPAKAEK